MACLIEVIRQTDQPVCGEASASVKYVAPEPTGTIGTPSLIPQQALRGMLAGLR